MSSIFGAPSKQSSTSQSSNQAYPMLSQALGGQISNGTGASNALSALLGVGGDPAAQQQAFQTFKNSTGYQQGLDQGVNAITGSAATRGLLDSGATAKAVDTYGQNYADSQYQNYLNPLQSLISGGNQAAGVVGQTGQTSTSNSSGTGQKQGAGGFLGSLLTSPSAGTLASSALAFL